MALEIGSPAPLFSLPATDGTTIALKDFKGKQNVVLYFYPKDMTPGCTKQACGFRDDLPQFAHADTAVLGVSPDPVKKHIKFTEKESLTFPLLADEQKQACEAYGVWGERSMYGVKYMGVERSTFLIDKQGKIRAIWRKVKVPGHVQEVLKAAQAL